MNIRRCPEYIPFMEALITFAELFPTDLVLYGITLNTFQIPETLEAHIKAQHGQGTRAAWIKTFQWGTRYLPFLRSKRKTTRCNGESWNGSQIQNIYSRLQPEHS